MIIIHRGRLKHVHQFYKHVYQSCTVEHFDMGLNDSLLTFEASLKWPLEEQQLLSPMCKSCMFIVYKDWRFVHYEDYTPSNPPQVLCPVCATPLEKILEMPLAESFKVSFHESPPNFVFIKEPVGDCELFFGCCIREAVIAPKTNNKRETH